MKDRISAIYGTLKHTQPIGHTRGLRILTERSHRWFCTGRLFRDRLCRTSRTNASINGQRSLCPHCQRNGSGYASVCRLLIGSLPFVNIQAAVAPKRGTSTKRTPNCSQGTTIGVPRDRESNTMIGTAPANSPITVPRNAVKKVCDPDRALRSRESAPILARVA